MDVFSCAGKHFHMLLLVAMLLLYLHSSLSLTLLQTTQDDAATDRVFQENKDKLKYFYCNRQSVPAWPGALPTSLATAMLASPQAAYVWRCSYENLPSLYQLYVRQDPPPCSSSTQSTNACNQQLVLPRTGARKGTRRSARQAACYAARNNTTFCTDRGSQ